ncbi:thioredoxin-like protein [Aspergillus ambiguus]|uniref:thioredoxin family protein n=1 Tax=Aspergillus ambiguus TaxID=176160 RepID=UPI003CCDFDDC
MPVREITTMDEFREVIDKDTPSVFDFCADSCASCKRISPNFDHLAEATQGPDFYKVNVDTLPDAAVEVGIYNMPTFMAFKGGAKMEELIGGQPERLEALVQRAAQMHH